MSEARKPTKTLELEVDIDAPLESVWNALTQGPGLANWFAPEGSVSRPGIGGEVSVSWGGGMDMTSRIDAWEPGMHVRWLDDKSQYMGPGTAIAVDYYLSTEGGKTRVRLVQSGFGESEGWDGFFEGTETGWKYFLVNLRIYLECHPGKVRRMIATRIKVKGPNERVWKHLLSPAAGLLVTSGAVKAGDAVQINLGEQGPLRAVVELAVESHALGLRIEDLDDAALLIEFEGGGESFTIGCWLSVYDAAKAEAISESAKRAFERVESTLP
jgi:uncharacterized protein YndB with AHSA1/START domain